MSERPFATVGGLIFSQEGEILLLRSKKWRDFYTFPGGKVEWGETCEEAFRREVWEETGLKLINVQRMDDQECILSSQFWKPSHFIMHDFVAHLDPGLKKDEVRLNEEAESFLWIKPAQALELPLQKECRTLIEKAALRLVKVGFENLRIDCCIGTLEQEREQEQIIFIDLQVQIPLPWHDQLTETVDYTHLASICRQAAHEGRFQLIESLGKAIVQQLLKLEAVYSVKIKIKKPSAIPEADYAFFEWEEKKCGH